MSIKERPILEGQEYSARRLLSQFAKTEKGKVFVLSKLIKREIGEIADMKVGEWEILRRWAYSRWMVGDWTIEDKFRNVASRIAEEYEVSLGQGILFGSKK